MDYFARLVRQSQLSIGAGEPAPPAGITYGLHEEAATDIVEVDAVRESLTDATVARAPSDVPSPPDLPAPPVSPLSPQPTVARLAFGQMPARMPVDDIQPGHPEHTAPAVKSDADGPRAMSTRMLREVVEWIAAGPPPVPGPKPIPMPAVNPLPPTLIERPVGHAPDAREESEASDTTPVKPAYSAASKTAPASAVRPAPAKPVATPTQTEPDAGTTPWAPLLVRAQERPQPAAPITETQEMFEVSIGKLSLHIEAPTPAPPMPSAPAPVAHAPAPLANPSGRLQRRYLRP